MIIRHWQHPALSISDTDGETWGTPVSLMSVFSPECQHSIRQMGNALLLAGSHNTNPAGSRENLTLWRHSGVELPGGVSSATPTLFRAVDRYIR
jgi:hypothetical protein